jgi:hypothetical protein
MKGDRGAQVGQYITVYDIQSVYLRDAFWAEDGSLTDLLQQIWTDCGECDDQWNRFLEMTEETEYTDYVEVR